MAGNDSKNGNGDQSLEGQIRSQLYRALWLLGADHQLLATVGSWGDTLNDGEVLKLLTKWNDEEEAQARQ
jgi:hypothetical protein